MKKIFSILIMCFWLTQTTAAYAVMVHYYDENGKIHYVNTTVAQVPQRYMDQVRPQLEAAERAQAEEKKEDVPLMGGGQNLDEGDAQTANPPKVILDVLMTSHCKGCMRLFSQLRVNKIFFRSHNVETSPRGKELYQQYQGMPLPITIVGDQAVSGPDIIKIKQLLEETGKKQ
ncbi:MAG TPA: hypothetical protein PLB05_05545 [Candidatus Omnitrophota bacterium]|nr:hypothetical protein [Candidatus Omnitrophota bacterium]HPN56423.1 hypothetical protein [Candidatus Omnitrophota bacterium]